MKKLIGKHLAVLGLVVVALTGCSKGFAGVSDYASDKHSLAPGEAYEVADGAGGEVPGDGQGAASGVVTAGEWNDIATWQFWGSLQNNKEWASHASYWRFFPYNFVYLELSGSDGSPAVGLKAVLSKDGNKVWEAVSDNTGHAVLWAGLFESTYAVGEGYSLEIDGKDYPEFEFTTLGSTAAVANKFTVASAKKDNAIDVAFIVDATGSMGDEIDFLKKDLEDIIKLVDEQCTAKVRTGCLFYRDEGDEYITRPSQFTTNLEDTKKFISKQEAAGGGDWPEAVHTALSEGLQSLNWSSDARSRVAFLVLDAPAHHEDAVIASCQKSIEQYAKMGIKIVPVSASGIDKACEYLLRSFALATNGTYVFITNDSGVGGDHIEATVGEYQVEKLRDLIARLIIAYAK